MWQRLIRSTQASWWLKSRVCLMKKSYLKEHPMKNLFKIIGLLMAISFLVSACAGANASAATNSESGKTIEYSLQTGMIDGKMAFVGVGGGIDGVTNPTLSANVGDTVKVTLSSRSEEHTSELQSLAYL